MTEREREAEAWVNKNYPATLYGDAVRGPAEFGYLAGAAEAVRWRKYPEEKPENKISRSIGGIGVFPRYIVAYFDDLTQQNETTDVYWENGEFRDYEGTVAVTVYAWMPLPTPPTKQITKEE